MIFGIIQKYSGNVRKRYVRKLSNCMSTAIVTLFISYSYCQKFKPIIIPFVLQTKFPMHASRDIVEYLFVPLYVKSALTALLLLVSKYGQDLPSALLKQHPCRT